MCGIAGCLDVDGPDEGAVRRMLGSLSHRGPDAEGVFARGQAVIGQTRLSVIDLVTGDPPVRDESGKIGAVLNGEIYNFKQLRTALAADGHSFSTAGDTETLAHLAEQQSAVDLARRLDGMFAFAVWDTSRNALLLGRDRLGKKPLYWWGDGRRLVFASELKALLAHPSVPRRLNPSALPDYLTFGYVSCPDTFYEGICQVPPGHVLVAVAGRAPVIERYWSPPLNRSPALGSSIPTLDEAATEVRSLLDVAVRRRLVADVPVGAFLSGGVDSSAVVALMAQARSRPVSTFTIGFGEGYGYDERPWARMVAERWATDHVELAVEPDVVELITELVHWNDQPFGDSSMLPTYVLARLTRQSVTVALCGDGGDELFAGYGRFSAVMALDRLQSRSQLLARLAGRVARRLPNVGPGRLRSLRRAAARADLSPRDALLAWVSFVPATDRRRLLDGHVERPARWDALWQASEGAPTLDRMLDITLQTYLLDDLLPKVDRAAMAHALEVRSPFLDTALLESVAGLPPGFKLQGASTKRVLKRAVEDLLPPEILQRPKRGFELPVGRWLREHLQSWTTSMLCSESSRLHAHVDRSAVEGLVNEHLEGVADNGQALFTLITLEEWLRREGW